ncbi:MAG TPA: class I SAM-dependent methyltransferase [Bacteroidia bacterium]|nr:class I SAM-dependent methyltransferase [Bacteroidia bacterium]HNU34755.1 class I SAM-dependent methyltransferase [Bacteroidia bacterium]
MRKKVSSILICPNSKKEGFKFYAFELTRNGNSIKDVNDGEINAEDDIKYGVAVSTTSNTAYPIDEYIGVFLSDADVDKHHHKNFLEKYVTLLPADFKDAVQNTLNRIYGATETSDGKWNREEMMYYDAEVETEEKRKKMLNSVLNKPMWRIFIPRKKHMIDLIAPSCKNEFVLEIGGGVCRTVSRLFNPAEYNYNYIGTDIAFKRLMVAKQATPAGDFLQASALNLPFKKNTFQCVISFGMLHHLPRPVEALEHCNEVLKNGGLITFHEPIIRPDLPIISSATARKLLRTYEHSEHDGKIDFDASIKMLESKNHEVLKVARQISVFRALTESLLKKISKKALLSKSVVLWLEGFDKIFLNTFCLLSKRFGPNAVLVVTRKKS